MGHSTGAHQGVDGITADGSDVKILGACLDDTASGAIRRAGMCVYNAHEVSTCTPCCEPIAGLVTAHIYGKIACIRRSSAAHTGSSRSTH
jgi:hypothetical protein